jgi:general secretion pathway protein M
MRAPADVLPAGGQFNGWWQELATRERRLVSLAALLVGLALLWWIVLAPAIASLRNASSQLPKLETALRQMHTLKVQAQSMAAQPRLPPQEVRRLLETSMGQMLGSAAQMQFTADRATVVLKNVPPDALAQWLVQIRANARMVPIEVRLTRTAGTGVATGLGWDGSVTLLLPAP